MLWTSGLRMKCSGMGILVFMFFILFGSGASAQESPPPTPFFDEIIAQMKFEKPTRIAGRFRSLDGYEDAIWIEWTHLKEDTQWRPVRSEMMFKALPRDAGMMEFFRKLKPGTSLHMTVQQDPDGNRRILELEGT
jgi:hypothetical protein